MVKRRVHGFTIVELLIVIVVIAILAIITIVAYNGIQARARESTLRSDFATVFKKFELYKVDNNTYPAANDTALGEAKLTFSLTAYNQILYCRSNDGMNAVILGRTNDSSKTYAAGSNRSFGEYTTNPIDQYTLVCPDLTGPSSDARYGYSAGAWRTWVTAQ